MINARKHYKNSVRHFNIEWSKRRTDSLLQAKYKNTNPIGNFQKIVFLTTNPQI